MKTMTNTSWKTLRTAFLIVSAIAISLAISTMQDIRKYNHEIMIAGDHETYGTITTLGDAGSPDPSTYEVTGLGTEFEVRQYYDTAPISMNTFKTVVSGTQTGSYNQTNLLSSDDAVDQTMFYKDTTTSIQYLAKTDPTSLTASTSGSTFDIDPTGSLGSISANLLSDDSARCRLYTGNSPETTYGHVNGYSNIPEHNIDVISVYARVWDHAQFGTFDYPSYIDMMVETDNGVQSSWIRIVTNPAEDTDYDAYLTLTSGAVLDRVRAGGYVSIVWFRFNHNEEDTHGTIYLMVDRVFISYRMYNFRTDFTYTMDFGAGAFTGATITEISVNLEMDYAAPCTFSIYDYAGATWNTAGPFTGYGPTQVTYINSVLPSRWVGNNSMRFNFYKANYYDAAVPANQKRIDLDRLRVTFKLWNSITYQFTYFFNYTSTRPGYTGNLTTSTWLGGMPYQIDITKPTLYNLTSIRNMTGTDLTSQPGILGGSPGSTTMQLTNFHTWSTIGTIQLGFDSPNILNTASLTKQIQIGPTWMTYQNITVYQHDSVRLMINISDPVLMQPVFLEFSILNETNTLASSTVMGAVSRYTSKLEIPASSLGSYNVSLWTSIAGTVGAEYVGYCLDVNNIFVIPNQAPVLTNPIDIIYQSNTTGHAITWIANDTTVDSANYTVLKNGITIANGLIVSGANITINVDGLTPNIYIYTLVVDDGAGYIVQDSVNVTAFNIAPIIISSGNAAFESNTTGHELFWSISDTSIASTNYRLERNGTILRNQAWIPDAPILLGVDGYLPAKYNFTVIAFDGYNETVRSTIILTVFNVAPAVLDVPSFSYECNSTGHSITWTITDTSRTTTSYTIRKNGGIQNASTWTPGTPITTTVDMLSVGSYNYTIIALDGLGGRSQDTVIVTVFNLAPAFTPPANISYQCNSTGHSISWTFTDASYGTTSFVLEKDGATVRSGSWISGTAITQNVTGFPVGIYNYTIVASDGLGMSARSTVLVTVFNLAPVFAEPANISYECNSTGHSISWTFTDASYGTTSFVLEKDGATVRSGSWVSGTSITQNVTGFPVGIYNYTIIASDGLGIVVRDTVIVTVYNLDPVVNAISDFTFEVEAEGISLNYTIVDNSFGTCTYVLFRNGTAIANGMWTPGVLLSLSIADLPVGTYNLTIHISDGIGEDVVDTVIVVVTDHDFMDYLLMEFLGVKVFIWIIITGGIVVVVAAAGSARARKKKAQVPTKKKALAKKKAIGAYDMPQSQLQDPRATATAPLQQQRATQAAIITPSRPIPALPTHQAEPDQATRVQTMTAIPVYCAHCKNRFEMLAPVDPSITGCPTCRNLVSRVISCPHCMNELFINKDFYQAYGGGQIACSHCSKQFLLKFD